MSKSPLSAMSPPPTAVRKASRSSVSRLACVRSPHGSRAWPVTQQRELAEAVATGQLVDHEAVDQNLELPLLNEVPAAVVADTLGEHVLPGGDVQRPQLCDDALEHVHPEPVEQLDGGQQVADFGPAHRAAVDALKRTGSRRPRSARRRVPRLRARCGSRTRARAPGRAGTRRPRKVACRSPSAR